MEEEVLLYHLLWMIDQMNLGDDITLHTRYNADAHAVDYLIQHGYAEYIGNRAWPETKIYQFRWTQKAKEIMERVP